MQALASLLLRCVLLLALWPGVQAWALADAGASPCARHGQPSTTAAAASVSLQDRLPADSAGLPRTAARSVAADPVATPVALHAAHYPAASAPQAWARGDACPDHATGNSLPDCCQGGGCGCRCAAPAVAAAVYLATPVPAAHDPVIVLFDYQPSHLLPQPYRPPIA